jgi:hypothetical protein
VTESEAHRTPFVLGTPIKNPADFFGRTRVLRELYDAVLNRQLTTVVGEHRCGNTSVIYQVLHEEQRARYLTPEQDRGLLFAFVSAQLAAEGPRALLRRIGLSIRRADDGARVEFVDDIDQRWLENYLEDLADRGRRLVLLIDELEVLADLDSAFWGWFESLVTEYDVAIVATSRTDLGRFRSERGSGPPFFNTFNSVYIGSFTPETVNHFLKEKSDITEFDFFAVRDFIEDLAGRFPYYMQVASALCYLQAAGGDRIGPEGMTTVRREFEARTLMLFEDAWPKLPARERDALTWLVLGGQPSPAPQTEADNRQALQSLERRGYLLEGRIFSSVFAAFVRSRVRRVALNPETNAVRVERRLVQIPPKDAALLAFFMDHEGEALEREDIVRAVWPEHAGDPERLTPAMLADALERLRAVMDAPGQPSHLERLGPDSFRFDNAPYPGLEPTA